VLAAVRQDGQALQYAAEKIKTDRDIKMAATGRNARAV